MIERMSGVNGPFSEIRYSSEIDTRCQVDRMKYNVLDALFGTISVNIGMFVDMD